MRLLRHIRVLLPKLAQDIGVLLWPIAVELGEQATLARLEGEVKETVETSYLLGRIAL